MKTLTLSTTHEALGAKMVPFAGYNMPIQYEGVTAEHLAVRNGVGVFDVSHMGEILISNENALALVQKISTNDASKLSIGKAQYSCMTNEYGGIVDDLIIYKIKEEQYLLVVNAANIDKDWGWINSQNVINAEIENVSDEYSLLAVQGPKALKVMQSLTSIDLGKIPFYHFEVGSFAGIDHVILSATGYTGSGGFEIYCKNSEVQQVWDALFKARTHHQIKPIGLAARDTLRLEMGYCLYGNDIDDATSPIESGLGWITKFSKDFVARNILEKQKAEGVTRRLIGFEMQERGIPRKGYEILDQNGNHIGHVTSGTMSPSLSKGIGMGYVQVPHHKNDTAIHIKIRDKQIPAKIVKLPFYKK